MPIFPHSRIFLGPSLTIVVSGPHIQLLNTTTGQLISSQGPDSQSTSGPVRCAVVNASNDYLVTSGDDKKLKIWQVDGLKLLSERELPKKATDIRFTRDSHTILVSDKFGDVFSYPLHPSPPSSSSPAPPKKSPLSSHENPSNGTLVLGHVSLLTCFLFSPCERYIITADRDEHIRVSWYPQGYNIEMFCLGHTKFVSAIHIPQFDEGRLISGGGDRMIYGWDWMTGVVKWEIDIWETVAPFVKVRAVRRRRMDGDEEDGEEKKKRPFIRRNRKGKGKAQDEGEERDESELVESPTEPVGSTSKEDQPSGEPLLVLHKIDTLDSSQGKHILFSAVGTSAIFSCPYPSSDHPDANIMVFDFGKPVIDFVIDDDERIWVSLDQEWDSREEEDLKAIRVVKFDGGALVETDDRSISPLLSSLNSQCLLPATSSDLKTLDLYAHLSSMPKNNDVDHNAMDRDISDGATTPQGKQLSKKELGRLRKKRELVEIGLVKGGEEEGEGEGRVKRAKPEGGDLMPEDGMDES